MSFAVRLRDEARRLAFQGSFERRACLHPGIPPTVAPSAGCQACIATGSRWVHLRMCLTCAAVGCCDSSAGKHARRHFNETGHPAIRSIEPGEAWTWCYVDRAYTSAREQRKD